MVLLLLLLNVVFISRRVRGLSFSSFTKGNWIRFWKGFDDGLSRINGSLNSFSLDLDRLVLLSDSNGLQMDKGKKES